MTGLAFVHDAAATRVVFEAGAISPGALPGRRGNPRPVDRAGIRELLLAACAGSRPGIDGDAHG